jgi:DNA-binding NarL/FixJ family response regulator
MTTLRILVVDDQEIIRHGLKLIINGQPDMTVVGEAGDGEEALRLAYELQPDIVLMDIKMPRMNGIQATRRLTQELRNTRVIILTTYDVDGWVFDGIRAGAKGYLLKDTSSERLQDVIRSVHRGESQIDPAVAGKVMDEFRRLSEPNALEPLPRAAQPNQPNQADAQDSVTIEKLTEREAEILQLVAEGKNNRDIAAQLFLSEGTVRNYVSTIMDKLHANDRTQMVVKAARRKMVKLD